MVWNSTASQTEFVRGITAVLAQTQGIAVLTDQDGRVLYGNAAFAAEASASGTDWQVPPEVLRDVLGSGQTSYHAITLASGRRTGFACRRVGGQGDPGPFAVIQEDGRETIVAKFLTAKQGLARSREERDRVHDNVQKLRAEANHWRLLSMTDRLTGLYNATGFRDRASAILGSGRMGALVYADLNGFKTINDTLGHAAGDALLNEIGEAILAAIRSGDLAGRIGGDEFAILLPDCPATELSKVVARLRKAMSRRIPVNRGAEQPALLLSVEAAVGTAVCPDEGTVFDSLMQLADARMYADKASAVGRRQGATGG